MFPVPVLGKGVFGKWLPNTAKDVRSNFFGHHALLNVLLKRSKEFLRISLSLLDLCKRLCIAASYWERVQSSNQSPRQQAKNSARHCVRAFL